MFARDTWTPPDALIFEHHEVRGDFPAVDGAVVILPARHHTREEDVARFIRELDRLSWSLVILSGDEEWHFPWHAIEETDTRKVWVMQPRPEHRHLSGLIPGGWYPGTREMISRRERTLDWFFAGQVTHKRRKDCVRYLRRIRNGHLLETEGYLQGMPKQQYFDYLSSSKIIPCPSGPMTVDTARPLEAMEAGCVPVVDVVTPRGEAYDYWNLVFAEDCPLPRVRQWAEIGTLIRVILPNFTMHSNRIFSFWQKWKRKITLQLDAQIRELANVPKTSHDPNNLITVVITTSPAPIHPSIDHISIVIESIREQLPTAEIIITADGVNPKDAHLAGAYQQYLSKLLWMCNFEWRNVVTLISDEWVHQANTTRAALDLVNTPYLLFVEHDTPVLGEIDWSGLCTVLDVGVANSIQLHFNESIHPDHQELILPGSLTVDGVPLLRTKAWWQRPHLSSTAFYREQVMSHFPQTSRTMIEDKMYGIVHCDFEDYGPGAWQDWRIAIYAPEGNMIRSGHLDSRGTHPKHEMSFE